MRVVVVVVLVGGGGGIGVVVVGFVVGASHPLHPLQSHAKFISNCAQVYVCEE